MENIVSKRWYDRDSRIKKMIHVIETLPAESQDDIAYTLIQFVNFYRQNRNEIELPVSIGKYKVLGLYKAYNKRRWYDKNYSLMSAMNILSTLPVEECANIAEGLLLSIGDQA